MTGMNSKIDLSGNVAVVTGGNGVIGSAFCSAMAECGAKIAVICRDPANASSQIESIRELGTEAEAFAANILNRDELLAARSQILERFGHVNILINCAGGAVKGATIPEDQFGDGAEGVPNFFEIDPEGIHQELDLNGYGTFLTTQIFAEVMVGRDNANIVNISSMGAYYPMTRIPGYAAGKAAVTNFTEWAATYFAKCGIRVNAIAPGFFQTKQNRSLQFNPDGTPSERSRKILNATPMGRYGRPEELIPALLFILNPENTFLTGAVIPVDGGFHCYLGV